MKNLFNKENSIFVWIILIALIGIFASTIYKNSQQKQTQKIKSSLDNIYLKKTIQEITNNLNPRFISKEYVSKSGDTYENIIEDLEISKKEKKIILDRILKEKSLSILKINQKFTFKIDNMSDEKVLEFKIETDKKNEVLFTKSSN